MNDEPGMGVSLPGGRWGNAAEPPNLVGAAGRRKAPSRPIVQNVYLRADGRALLIRRHLPRAFVPAGARGRIARTAMGTGTLTEAEDAMDAGSSGSPVAVTPAPLPVTREEQRLRRWMKVWSASFALEVVLYLWWAFGGPDAPRSFAVNSVAKDLTFLVLGMLVISDVRRFGRLMTVIVLGHLAIAGSLAALLIAGRTSTGFPGVPGSLLGVELPDLGTDWRLPVWLAAAMFASAHMGWLHVTARRARYGLEFLSPAQHDTLVALAETVLDAPRVPPAKIAAEVDRYWAHFNGRDRSMVRLSLLVVYVWPTLGASAPFPLLSAEGRRRFVERRFIEKGRVLLPNAVRAAIRFAIQMVYMGYYSDEATHADTGYVPFSRRKPPANAQKVHSRLRAEDPDRVSARDMEADVVIVGSGAGGGVLADRLVEQGHDVLMIERGDFVDPATFTENETEMYSRLYSDGAVQISRDFSFQMLQGRCVGGGTVVNNAVCFDLPPEVLDAWNDNGAGLPPSLDASSGFVRDLMRVERQHRAPRSLGVEKVVRAIAPLGLTQLPNRSGPVDANINGCLGCGYCNIGCAYGKKQSMLDLVLPAAQRRASERRAADPSHRGRLRVLPTCEVTTIERGSGARPYRVAGVNCLVGAQRRELRVKAGTVVVAAGAIHSSRLLQRSLIGGPRVGRDLCANIATLMVGEFEERLDAFTGLQLANYVAPPQERGYVLETWFNPLVITALSMPGWLGVHQQNMRRYAHMMSMGVLLGTDPQPSNRVKRSWLTGREFSFAPSAAETARLARALTAAGETLFAAGARRVMPATFDYREYHDADELGDLGELLARKGNASLQSSHPQGGNAISEDPARGVVDPRFRVHGYDNLYVADASVFPTAVTVNPQLTVMALAHHAATHADGLGALAR